MVCHVCLVTRLDLCATWHEWISLDRDDGVTTVGRLMTVRIALHSHAFCIDPNDGNVCSDSTTDDIVDLSCVNGAGRGGGKLNGSKQTSFWSIGPAILGQLIN